MRYDGKKRSRLHSRTAVCECHALKAAKRKGGAKGRDWKAKRNDEQHPRTR